MPKRLFKNFKWDLINDNINKNDKDEKDSKNEKNSKDEKNDKNNIHLFDFDAFTKIEILRRNLREIETKISACEEEVKKFRAEANILVKPIISSIDNLKLEHEAKYSAALRERDLEEKKLSEALAKLSDTLAAHKLETKNLKDSWRDGEEAKKLESQLKEAKNKFETEYGKIAEKYTLPDLRTRERKIYMLLETLETKFKKDAAHKLQSGKIRHGIYELPGQYSNLLIIPKKGKKNAYGLRNCALAIFKAGLVNSPEKAAEIISDKIGNQIDIDLIFRDARSKDEKCQSKSNSLNLAWTKDADVSLAETKSSDVSLPEMKFKNENLLEIENKNENSMEIKSNNASLTFSLTNKESTSLSSSISSAAANTFTTDDTFTTTNTSTMTGDFANNGLVDLFSNSTTKLNESKSKLISPEREASKDLFSTYKSAPKLESISALPKMNSTLTLSDTKTRVDDLLDSLLDEFELRSSSIANYSMGSALHRSGNKELLYAPPSGYRKLAAITPTAITPTAISPITTPSAANTTMIIPTTVSMPSLVNMPTLASTPTLSPATIFPERSKDIKLDSEFDFWSSSTSISDIDSIMDSVKFERKSIPKPIRRQIWDKYVGREKGVALCYACEYNEIRALDFVCGHVTAVKNGGENTIENLRPICGECNTSMGTMNMEKFKEWLKQFKS